MWRTASTTLPVPASPLERIIAAPSAIRRSASPRLVAPQTNGTLKAPLVDVVGLVGGRQHLGLVDVVDLERLEHLRLDEVPDAGLGHHGDGHGLLDPLDHGRVGHAGDAAVRADVGGHALERHDGGRARGLGHLRLLGVTTSMITPPLSISARPALTRKVPVSVAHPDCRKFRLHPRDFYGPVHPEARGRAWRRTCSRTAYGPQEARALPDGRDREGRLVVRVDSQLGRYVLGRRGRSAQAGGVHTSGRAQQPMSKTTSAFPLHG